MNSKNSPNPCSLSSIPLNYTRATRDARIVQLRSPSASWQPRLENGGSVVIDALKYSHAGPASRVIRLHESVGRSARVRLCGLGPDAVVYSATLIEDRLRREETRDGECELVFRPFEVKTLLVEEARTTARSGRCPQRFKNGDGYA